MNTKVVVALGISIGFVQAMEKPGKEELEETEEVEEKTAKAAEAVVGESLLEQLPLELQQQIFSMALQADTSQQALANLLLVSKTFKMVFSDPLFQRYISRLFYNQFIPNMTITQAVNFAIQLSTALNSPIFYEDFINTIRASTTEAQQNNYMESLLQPININHFMRHMPFAIMLRPQAFYNRSFWITGPTGGTYLTFPLHGLAEIGNTEIMRAALQDPTVSHMQRVPSIDINAQDLLGNTALHIAVENGDRAMVNLLLEYGADPFATDRKGQTPLEIARKINASQALIQLLEKAGKQQQEEVEQPAKKRRFDP